MQAEIHSSTPDAKALPGTSAAAASAKHIAGSSPVVAGIINIPIGFIIHKYGYKAQFSIYILTLGKWYETVVNPNVSFHFMIIDNIYFYCCFVIPQYRIFMQLIDFNNKML